MMPKTITLRLSDETYQRFSAAAESEKRPISNLIETLAIKKLEEDMFMDRIEMEDIIKNPVLKKRFKRGIKEANERKGKFVE